MTIGPTDMSGTLSSKTLHCVRIHGTTQWGEVWNAKCDKMASELPDSAYSDWTIGTRVTERVGDNANVIMFEVTFWRTYLRPRECLHECFVILWIFSLYLCAEPRLFITLSFHCRKKMFTWTFVRTYFTFMKTFSRTYLRSQERLWERTYVPRMLTNIFCTRVGRKWLVSRSLTLKKHTKRLLIFHLLR